ncbi:MAG: hypothetical protein QOK06_1872 [Acidimicrobiaceae bacterium]
MLSPSLCCSTGRGNLVETAKMLGMRTWMLLGLAAVLVAGCTHDGRTLRPPPPGATLPATTVPLTSTTAALQPGVGSVTPADLVLTSSAFAANAAMPVELTCDGTNVSPSLQWTGVPTGTTELVLTVTDPDAKGLVHWVIAGLSSVLRGLGPGAAPEGAIEATNGTGAVGWTGPCPPQGPAHHYVFTLYALSAPSGVTAGMPATEAIVRVTGASILAETTLTGIYRRQS